MIPFAYEEPASVEEALALLARHGDAARPIAGGTALVNLMKQRLVQPQFLVGLRHLPALGGIDDANRSLRLGALCTHRAIERSAAVQRQAPVLAEAFRQVASVRIRTMATIGGALAHADPNQDPPPVLIALDARVRLCSRRGERELPVQEFFRGYYETVLEPDELVTEVTIPRQPEASGAAFLKFLPRTQDDYATVSVAARLRLDGDRIGKVRVALGGVGATPVRATAVEDALRGEPPLSRVVRDAASLVAGAVDPITDFRGSADYKRTMAVVFVRRALEQALTRALARS